MGKKMYHFSVLDLSPIPEGSNATVALRNSLDLAQKAEKLGYNRYWLAEHHNMPGIASAATSVVIGHIAAGTKTIRVGAGGIMLPNHSPLVIAEQFGTLASLYPDRIDLGLGRAPGGDKLISAAMSYGSKIGILHGAAQYVNQNSDGQIEETESISAGLDYPGISPLHCFLKDTKRARYTAASDEEALKAYQLVTKYENLRPSLEPSHAFSVAIKEAKKLSKDTIVIINSCGDAYKDRGILEKRLGKKYVKSN